MRNIITLSLILIAISVNSQCDKIKKEVDKYTGKITWQTPLELNPSTMKVTPIQLSKVYTKDTMYALTLTCEGDVPSAGKGVYILFYNGSKIIREDEDVDVSVNSLNSNYRYTAIIQISREELKLLKSIVIEDFRLSVYDAGLDDERINIKENIRCLIAAK
jgi:hypothetical protein